MKDLASSNGLLVQWLEDFKSKFGGFVEAIATIEEVETALKRYKEFYAAVSLPLALKKAREARKADGSVLEYGLDWQLERFTGAVILDIFKSNS